MSFWSGETLEKKLPALITPAGAFDPKQIECAAYALRLGSEVFITSDLPEVGGAKDGVKMTLARGQQFRITPGQFAFLESHETVEVPNDAVALISMKATYKLRGLINVSGFHVDPGWKDPLLFAVYNAGPSPVCLTQGMPLFLIWYASLDQVTSKTYSGKGKSIDSELISNMSGEVFSPTALRREVGRLRDELRNADNRVVVLGGSVDTVSKISFRLAIAAATLIVGALVYLYKEVSDARLELAKIEGRLQTTQGREAQSTGVAVSPQAPATKASQPKSKRP